MLMRMRQKLNSVHLLHFETKTGRRCSRLEFVILEREGAVRPEKFQFLEKEQNSNFGYKIVISVKNP